ncbi:tyrosine recombinase XerC [Halalkalibacter sp. APA_J-10(15)]|uniref:site-specific integrase n=1 Tax=Halalkalibacter sp. APA_J-10(15) TaxID=2933805 RepID=UPI001FF628B2|nr:site-specific integrase [Halalkalibacter sp. APA_J-10(15)]MCK0472520.1 site-specific integrase [Halalkalibacter sp. APA_J-10(15)]
MATGSYRHRGQNKWQLEVDLGYVIDPHTKKKKRKKKYKTITAKGSREVEKELITFVAEVTDEGYIEPEKISFENFVKKQWLPKFARKKLAGTTSDTYILHLEKRILPAFQLFQLYQIKPIHIIDFLHNLSEEGMRQDGKQGSLSSATIFYHYRILKSIFKFAVKCKLIKESPLEGVEKPKVTGKEINVYDDEQVIELMRCLENELLHWQIAIKIAISTGLRRSELLGLEWKHIDTNEGLIMIRQKVTYTKEKGYFIDVELSSKEKKRNLSLPKSLIKPLEKLRAIRGKERLAVDELWDKDRFFIFANENGKPYHPRSINRFWERFLNKNDLPYINFHALRHTSASLLINEGVHANC